MGQSVSDNRVDRLWARLPCGCADAIRCSTNLQTRPRAQPGGHSASVPQACAAVRPLLLVQASNGGVPTLSDLRLPCLVGRVISSIQSCQCTPSCSQARASRMRGKLPACSNQKASQDASRNPFLPTPSYMRQHFTYQPLRKLEGTQPWYTPVTEPVSHASIPHYIFNMVSLAAIGLRSRDGSAPYGSRACSG